MAYRYPFTPYPDGWFWVGYGDDLKAGEVRPVRYFGRDLVLFRTGAGRPCLLDAYCPHVGAHLGHGGEVVDESIQCPFHGWRMDGEGRCVHIPGDVRIPERARVRAWPIEEANGVIMAYHDAGGRPPTWRPARFEEYASAEWTMFRRGASWCIRVHVQDLVENGMDNAHFGYLHPQQTIDMRTEGVEEDGHVFVHRTFQRYNVFGLAKLFVDEVTGPLVVTAFGLGYVVNRAIVDAKIRLAYTFAFYFTPLDDEHVEVNCMLSMKRLRAPFVESVLLRKAIREGKRTIDQDVPIWEHKLYRDRPLLSAADGPIMRFRKWARRFYSADTRAAPAEPDS